MNTFEGNSHAALFQENEKKLENILSDVKSQKEEKKSHLLSQFLFVAIFGFDVKDVNRWVENYYNDVISFEKLRRHCILKLQQQHIQDISK